MTETPALDAAVREMRDARTNSDALAPLRRILTDADAALRSAATAARDAGLAERVIADHLGVAQPTVHSWLDGRASGPVPGPNAAATAWTLHHLASALTSQTLRLMSQVTVAGLDGIPSRTHIDPLAGMRMAYDKLQEITDLLGRAATAVDYAVERG